jgi:IS5 family transposase
VDEGSGLVRQAEMTSANVHDSRFGEALIQGDEQAYFADRAYNSQALRETLERRGLVDGIAWKVKHSRYPLETCQTFHNACHLQLVAVAMNMKRALVIRRAA